MLEKRKRAIMVGVIAVCLVSAGAIIHLNLPPNIAVDPVPPNAATWVICRNPACGAGYEMNLREYYKYLHEHADAWNPKPPGLVCKGCGQESVYRAIKCKKCERVFERGTVAKTFADRCPECGYSEIEEQRKAAEVGGTQTVR